ncbi:MAG: hypothetical protein U5R31_05275 [Acidimicrobiia bacterium]|nr:hypothetical protein [Acidimicrobiia bacterium]
MFHQRAGETRLARVTFPSPSSAHQGHRVPSPQRRPRSRAVVAHLDTSLRNAATSAAGSRPP